jgi:short-subunit dehydrogenase
MTERLVMVVTGATNGIGEAAAIELARRGARVGIVARSSRKAEVTAARIQAAAPGAPVDVFIGDLAPHERRARGAHEDLDRYEHIDVLVNAGIQLPNNEPPAKVFPRWLR